MKKVVAISSQMFKLICLIWIQTICGGSNEKGGKCMVDGTQVMESSKYYIITIPCGFICRYNYTRTLYMYIFIFPHYCDEDLFVNMKIVLP